MIASGSPSLVHRADQLALAWQRRVAHGVDAVDLGLPFVVQLPGGVPVLVVDVEAVQQRAQLVQIVARASPTRASAWCLAASKSATLMLIKRTSGC